MVRLSADRPGIGSRVAHARRLSAVSSAAENARATDAWSRDRNGSRGETDSRTPTPGERQRTLPLPAAVGRDAEIPFPAGGMSFLSRWEAERLGGWVPRRRVGLVARSSLFLSLCETEEKPLDLSMPLSFCRTSDQAGLPAKFKHIIQRRKRN